LVETAIYVLLGALTTALLALLALPAISRRAFRLAQAKARLSAPLSAAEAQAERDALRGRHAIDLALAERNAAAAEEASAQAQIALGERAVAIAHRDAELAGKTADIARLHATLEAQARELEACAAEISAREVAMYDLAGQREATERRREEEAGGFEQRQLRFDALQAELEGRIARLARELSDLRHASDGALAAAAARVAEAKRDLAASEANGGRLADQMAELYERLSDAAVRENEFKIRLQALAGARIEAEGAAQVARVDRELAARDSDGLRQQLAASQARANELGEADEALRRAIARLGREMAARPSSETARSTHETTS